MDSDPAMNWRDGANSSLSLALSFLLFDAPTMANTPMDERLSAADCLYLLCDAPTMAAYGKMTFC